MIGLRIGRDGDPESAQPGRMVALEEQLDDQIAGIVHRRAQLKDRSMLASLAAAQRPSGLRIAVDRGRDGGMVGTGRRRLLHRNGLAAREDAQLAQKEVAKRSLIVHPARSAVG